MHAAVRYQEERPRPKNARVARTAADNRARRGVRIRYTAITRFSAVLLTALFLLLAYVTLTASMTGETYALQRVKEQRAALAAQSARLDDHLNELRSQERLATLAARLGMREPQQFAIVRLPQPKQDEHIALLSPLLDVLTAKPAVR